MWEELPHDADGNLGVGQRNAGVRAWVTNLKDLHNKDGNALFVDEFILHRLQCVGTVETVFRTRLQQQTNRKNNRKIRCVMLIGQNRNP